MCGIFGILSAKPYRVAQTFANKISSLMHLRGPNGTGFYGYNAEPQKVFLQSTVPYEEAWNVFFMHKRLSILDLDTHSNQPMQSNDGRYVITFNGEIYNYKTLRFLIALKTDVFWRGIHMALNHCMFLKQPIFSLFLHVSTACWSCRNAVGKQT